jgi:hypothetical protein
VGQISAIGKRVWPVIERWFRYDRTWFSGPDKQEILILVIERSQVRNPDWTVTIFLAQLIHYHHLVRSGVIIM